jgi:phosphoadenosine phosphosulfate reductase
VRASARKVEWDAKFQLLKVNPIADWTSAMVWGHALKHNVPYNPLHDKNYPSIGCTHCTRAIRPGESARAGRWAGLEKTECGLHVGAPAEITPLVGIKALQAKTSFSVED